MALLFSCIDNDPAATEIYTYAHTFSLIAALPCSARRGVTIVRRAQLGAAQGRSGPGGPSMAAACPTRGATTMTASPHRGTRAAVERSEEHTSELQSLMRLSYAVFCLKKKKLQHQTRKQESIHNTHNINVSH